MDDMEEVTQRFVADVTEYVAEVDRAVTESRELAGATEEARAAMDGVRDKAIEAAAALGIYRDEQGRIRDEAGRFVSEARLQEMGFSGIRDKAIEAAVAVRELRAEESKGGGRGFLGSLLGGIGGLFGGGGGGGGGLGGAAGAAEGGLGGLSGIVTMLALVEAAVMVIGPEVAALGTGFLAAGLGVGAFAALAIPTFKQVFGAVGDTKKQLAKLPEPVQTMVIEIRNLKSEWNQMTKAIQPQVAGVFGQAIGIIVDQMPKLMPLAESVIPAISQVLAMLDKGLGSPEFAYFLKFMESLAGPVLTAVASGMAGLGERLMMIMELFSKKDVINSVNIAFRILGFLLQLTQGLIMEGMDAWDLLIAGLHNAAAWFDRARHASADFAHNVAAHFDEVRHDVATWGHDVAHVFDDFRHDVAEVGHDVAHYWDDLRHDTAEVGHDVAHAFDVMRHDVAAAVDGALSWVRDHWKLIVGWLVAPIGMAVFEIKTHTHQIAQSFDALRHDVAAILGGARHDIAAFADWVPHVIRVAFDTTRHNTAAAVDGLRHDVAAAFDHVRHDTAAAMGWMRHEIAHAFDEARHDVASATATVRHNVAAAWDDVRHETAHLTDNVVAFFERLPGRILRELAALPGEMLHVGENVILGLIHGIESAASQIPGIMRGLAADVASYFTNPLKLFSPSRVFFEHGMNIVLGAVNGVRAYAPVLRQAMRDLGGGVAAGGLPGIAAGAPGYAAASTGRPTVNITANFAPGMQGYNDPRFLQYLQVQMQEAILRYNVNNPNNGLALGMSGGRL